MKETSPKSNNGTILDINESFKIEFDPISDALAAIRNGECIIVVDDERRENEGIVIDSKSGTSGGGREPNQKLLLSECGEGLSAYGLINHRHTSEIEQVASIISGNKIELLFTPHLVPISRGMHSTIYGRLRDPGLTSDDCRILLDNYYRNFKNIKVLPVDTYPSTKWVKNTNQIFLSVKVDIRNGRIIILSVIDNLLKGQTGQAIQNLNLMSGFSMDEGLDLTNNFP